MAAKSRRKISKRKYLKSGPLAAKKSIGRPSKNASRVMKQTIKKRFIEVYGLPTYKTLEYMGYHMMNKTKKGAPKKVNPITQVEIVDPTPVNYSTDVARTFRTILAAFINGKEVHGFTVLPALKAATNPTVDFVVIPDFSPENGFPPNHPLRGKALVLLKSAFVDPEFRSQHGSFQEFLAAGGKVTANDAE